jgi:hypothetical protein
VFTGISVSSGTNFEVIKLATVWIGPVEAVESLAKQWHGDCIKSTRQMAENAAEGLVMNFTGLLTALPLPPILGPPRFGTAITSNGNVDLDN